MSLDTWKKEAQWWESPEPMPSTIPEMAERMKIKWAALDALVLRKHEVVIDDCVVVSMKDPRTKWNYIPPAKRASVGVSACMYCASFTLPQLGYSCVACPLARADNGKTCGSDNSAYDIWYETGDVKPMLKALEASKHVGGLREWKKFANWWDYKQPVPETRANQLLQMKKKWIALQPRALAAFGLTKIGSRIVDEEGNSVDINIDSCLFCFLYYVKETKCDNCPISKDGKQCADSGTPFKIWVETGNAKPMIDLLYDLLWKELN